LVWALFSTGMQSLTGQALSPKLFNPQYPRFPC
jgi:hypothetical protein